ncbi:MAG: hypothetical protein KGH79_02860 [Patescibacteria group bacterium]|nr:hypothetical protein [Patescibacteria group bacterium]
MKTSRIRNITGAGVIFSILVSQALFALPASASVSNWQKGASFYPSSTTDFSSGNFQQSVKKFKADGGTQVNLIIPYYQSNTGSTDISPGYNTPTDAALIAGIQFTHAQGLQVQISIYLDSYTQEWRALINPSDRNSWYNNYGNVLVHYGQLAQSNNVELYMLGAELINMASSAANPDNTERWIAMIHKVRSVYSGKLTYDANRGGQDWASELPNIQFWNLLDYIGVSAYYNLTGDGSVASLKAGWQNVNNYDINPIVQKWNKPVIFTEVGYRSVSGAHNQPWDSWDSGPYDAQEQVNDYTALFQYWDAYSYVQGVDWWWWSPDPNYGGNGNTDYTPQNKPAEQVLAQWFGTSISTPPPTPSGTPAFESSVSASPAQPNVGNAIQLNVTIEDAGSALSNGVVDIEVYDSSNTRVFQKFFENQNIAGGATAGYTASWTPSAQGTYRVAIGVFSGGWTQNYSWNNSAATIVAGQTAPPPAPTSATTDVWWPVNGAHASGVQPFKAMLEGVDVSQYTMYWQVDGGSLLPMNTNNTDYPHKEAQVDLSNWHWNGAGPYTVTFVSKDLQGAIISQKSVQIWTQ